MGRLFEELDHQATPMGDISLRRRREPNLDVDVFEAKLGDEFLMSSLFTVAEIALAELGLAALDGTAFGRGSAAEGPPPEGSAPAGFSATDHGRGGHANRSGALDVVVGGLGLGYTARAVLDDGRVGSLRVIEALGEVASWHERGLLPLSSGLVDDTRCSLVVGDFFDLMRSGAPFGPGAPDRIHALLVDIDHAPDRLLHASHAEFYTAGGLAPLVDRLHPGGVFALWSDDPPDAAFVDILAEVFAGVATHEVDFANPITGGESSNTIYVAITAT